MDKITPEKKEKIRKILRESTRESKERHKNKKGRYRRSVIINYAGGLSKEELEGMGFRVIPAWIEGENT